MSKIYENAKYILNYLTIYRGDDLIGRQRLDVNGDDLIGRQRIDINGVELPISSKKMTKSSFFK
jgi:hypothetical protein